MSKFRWAIAEVDLTLAALADRLRKCQFRVDSESYSRGFRIQEKRSGRLVGQFIERDTWIEQFELPSGEHMEEQRSSIQVTHFQLREEHPLNVVMIDPPRRISPFFNALAEASAFKVSVDPIKADLMKWVASLESLVGDVTVTYADCSGVRVSDGVVGRFAFRGTRDVRQEVSRAAGTACPVLEAVKCDLRVNGSAVAIELYRTGVAKLDKERLDLFRVVDEALQSAVLEDL